MAEEAFVIGFLHLANLCSANVILAQCDPIQKILWESNPNRENMYVLQKLQLQQTTIARFQITGHITKLQPLSYTFKNNSKKLYCPIFFQNVHNIS